MSDDLDLVGKLTPEKLAKKRHRLLSMSPDTGKYGDSAEAFDKYLSEEAEWRECARVQLILLQTRAEFGQANKRHIEEVKEALEKIDPLNMALLERKLNHDQLAVIAEIGRHVSPETKALLHPGTTSYDVLDTARSSLYKKAWNEVMRPKASEVILKLCEHSENSQDIIQVGRTHLQDTSPVPFATTFALYAGRLADRVERADEAFNRLRGKVSGIVGTGAGIEAVIGKGKSIDFEVSALRKLGLEPDYTATQIVQKERLADAAHAVATLMLVTGDFANDMRILYSSAIGEVTSQDAASRLGGSSAGAGKNNPINYENIAGKVAVVQAGMNVVYAMTQSDLQRDLRGSVQARYQPTGMMVETYESLERLAKELPQLTILSSRVGKNLSSVRDRPDEAMVAILRGHGYDHSRYGVGHSFVKEMMKIAKRQATRLIDVSLEDQEFKEFYETQLRAHEKDILNGDIEKYVGSAHERARINREYARRIAKV